MSLYITTPIFYVNAQPHLGHAYTTIIADTVCRFNRLLGEDVYFQTGTDEHGDKIAQAASDAGLAPKAYADKISSLFREAWPPLLIEPDYFIRTTDPEHVKTVQHVLQKVYDQGDIYYSDYTGLYCQGCERFLTDKEIVDGKCPDHQTTPSRISEQNYFFRMSKYQDWLIDHIKKNPDFISPERYRNEVLSFLKEPLEDLCISRPVSRLTWGIPLPFDDRFVTYVWFDALINYLTGIGYPEDHKYKPWWEVAEHIIAKDILKPHAIYWPTMLQSMGLPPYKKLHVHGYWNVNETKMSKSIGNVVRPEELVSQFGADTVRYFLMREMSFGLDASYSPEAIIARQNSDLANDLGNLFSRSFTMVKKFCGNTVPHPGTLAAEDEELARAALTMLDKFSLEMAQFSFNKALMEIWNTISLANKYIVSNAPWELAKSSANAERLNTVLYSLLETLRLISIPLHAIMPETASKMATALGADREPNIKSQGTWGLLKPGKTIEKLPALFPRIERAGKKKAETSASPKIDTNKQRTPEEPSQNGLISFDEFKKLDLRVAQVIAAEKIPKTERLLKLTVMAPEERTIVAGIAEHYDPEDLLDKEVVIVANLKPTKLKGVVSHGMVLAAKDKDKLTLATVLDNISPGSKIS